MTSRPALTISYAPIAERQLTQLERFLLTRDPSYALRIARGLRATIQYIQHFPLGAREGRDPETYERPVHDTPLLVVYEINSTASEIIILGVFHSSQER